MLKKTITYEDFDGNKQTEDFYFNMTKAELFKMDLREGEGFQHFLKKIIDAKDTKSMMEIFENIIMDSVGEKSPDGKHFIKDPEKAKLFKYSAAYGELFTELTTDDKAAAAFVIGIMPSSLGGEVQKQMDSGELKLPSDPPPPTEEPTQNVFETHPPTVVEEQVEAADDPKPWITENREPTQKELMEMSKSDLLEVMKRKNS